MAVVFFPLCPLGTAQDQYKKHSTETVEKKGFLSIIHIQKIEFLAYWKQCLEQIPGRSFQYWFLDNFSSVVKEKKQEIIPGFKGLIYEERLRGLLWLKKNIFYGDFSEIYVWGGMGC